ncbi:MAG: DUF1565 domain-containing protein [Candidatus Cloacimonetes bacterium]|nr:DUF1565 domain-containing protein [Candidatus Cloacimonadota bacterium]
MKKRIILILLLTTGCLFTKTNIPAGGVSGSWTEEGSPYLVEGDIAISAEDSLHIQPGVEVQFLGHFALVVEGILLAQGTVNDSIYFTIDDTTGFSNNSSNSGGWRGIWFQNTSTLNDSSLIEYCHLSFGKNIISPEYYGGLIRIEGYSQLRISNSTIIRGWAAYGGGIYCCAASPVIVDNRLSDNKANFNGGGVYCLDEAIPLISFNQIFCNSSAYGGGIHCFQADPIITSNLINSNLANNGGGVELFQSQALLSDNSIQGNTAVRGAGIYLIYSSANLVNNKIEANLAEGDNSAGGGIFSAESESMISGNIIRYNQAGSNGAGIYCENSISQLQSNTISANQISSSDGSGGGICLVLSQVEFSDQQPNSIYLNFGEQGRDFASDQPVSVFADTLTVSEPVDFIAVPSENFLFQNLNTVYQPDQTLFIDPSGSDLNSGTTESEPFLTITCAISLFANLGLELNGVKLAAGRYSPSLTGENYPLSLPSGFDLSAEIDQEAVLDAENTAGILNLENKTGITVSNLTLCNGNNIKGGAVYSFQSQSVFEDCLFYGNQAELFGGALYVEFSEMILLKCTLSRNQTENESGAILFWNSSGLALNSIFWNNSDDEILNLSQNLSVAYCTVENGWEGIGNLDSDPLFLNPAGNDFRLSDDSPCIDAGTDYWIWNDLIFQIQEEDFYGSAPDIGVDEWEASGIETEMPEFLCSKLQNYPNPFNARTTFRYSTSSASRIELTIYNLKGEKIIKLIDLIQSPGEHLVIWDGSDHSGRKVSSGIYYYNIKIGGENFSGKMILLK